MRTVVLGPPPPELAALIARRRELGLDKYDEVWKGEYHMAPMARLPHGWIQMEVGALLKPIAASVRLFVTGPFNLGSPDDFRVPDLGLHVSLMDAVWVPRAAVVVEVESPDDETWEKMPFYASHGVAEMLVVSPQRRSVTWLVLDRDHYVESAASRSLGPRSASDSLAEQIDWPPT